MTFNKTINTNVVEQLKSATILILIVGIAAFIGGVQYQKSATVSVENKVVLSSAQVAPTADVKK